MFTDLLGWAAVAAVALAGVTAAAGGCVVAVRQRRVHRQPEFSPYVPKGQMARWQHTRYDPEDTLDLNDRPLLID